VDLHVPLHRLGAHATGRPELGGEPAGQFGDGLLQALGDGGEALLVAGDQRRVALGREPLGKVKRTGNQRVPPFLSGFLPRPAIMKHDRGLAASPRVRYKLKTEGYGFLPSL
jgi:hypothetical protein